MTCNLEVPQQLSFWSLCHMHRCCVPVSGPLLPVIPSSLFLFPVTVKLYCQVKSERMLKKMEMELKCGGVEVLNSKKVETHKLTKDR